ncbi:MAG TPA: peptide-methionine (S)-S-oxide reductase MsrA [Thermoanaerobaculia bacterium]|nr:peptide-methionine (S)-S-oxide reductase MsrA [Thermoanaerobaculia bacterium]
MTHTGMPRLPLATLLLGSLLAGAAAVAGAAGTAPPAKRAVATFAMGCFWCAEDAFEGKPGVLSVVSGYTGGNEKNPTYEQVSAHRTGHFESIEVTYDPAKTSYEKLLDVFWHNVDPGDDEGQFCDKGPQYRSAIFVHGDEQRRAAEASKTRVVGKLGKVATLILPAGPFYAAEGYHQDFAEKNPLRYRFYSTGCGRAARLRQVWGSEAGGQH